MTIWRAFIRQHVALALLLVCFGLAMRGAVPAGYMVADNTSGPIIKVCGEANGASVALDVWKGRKGPAKAPHHAPEGACPYSVLSYGSLSGPSVLAAIPAGIAPSQGVRAVAQPTILGGLPENSLPPARAPPPA